jgi:hypothetical protein
MRECSEFLLDFFVKFANLRHLRSKIQGCISVALIINRAPPKRKELPRRQKVKHETLFFLYLNGRPHPAFLSGGLSPFEAAEKRQEQDR